MAKIHLRDSSLPRYQNISGHDNLKCELNQGHLGWHNCRARDGNHVWSNQKVINKCPVEVVYQDGIKWSCKREFGHDGPCAMDII